MNSKSQNNNVLIAGGSGLIGQALAHKLTELGFVVSILSRRKRTENTFKTYWWDPDKGEIESGAFINKQYIINLTGESIAAKYWTKKQKKRILNSRLNAIRTLSKSLGELNKQPLKFLSASAIGYYGSQAQSKFTELSSKGTGFLADVCDQWEKELTSINCPVTKLRIGMVLSEKGGYLAQLKKVLKMQVNVLFGKGDQYISWIHINDLVGAIVFILEAERNSPVYNLTSPNALQAHQLNKAILRQLNIKSLTIRVSEALIRNVLGSFSELFLSSQNVFPEKLLEEGFTFSKPEIEQALDDLI